MVILKTSSDPRSQGLGVQPYRTAPHHLRCGSSPVLLVDQLRVWRFQWSPPNQDINCKCRLLPILLTNQPQIRGSHDPSMDSINLMEQLTDHREMLLVFTRVSKDTSEHPDGADTQGGVAEWSSSPSLSGTPFSQHLHRSTNSKHSCTRPCPWGVAGGSTTQAWSIINSPFSAALSSQEKVESGTEDAKLLNVGSCFPWPFPSRSHPGSAL